LRGAVRGDREALFTTPFCPLPVRLHVVLPFRLLPGMRPWQVGARPLTGCAESPPLPEEAGTRLLAANMLTLTRAIDAFVRRRQPLRRLLCDDAEAQRTSFPGCPHMRPAHTSSVSSPEQQPGNPSAAPGDPLIRARELALGGMFLALAVLIPLLFHAAGGPLVGKMLLPMHLPVLVAGLLLSPGIAAAVGFLAPLASALLTGMPPWAPPIALLMAPELAALAVTGSWLYRRARHRRGGVFLAVIGAMIAARCVTSVEVLTLAPLLGFHTSVYKYVILGMVTGVWGLVLQLAIVPAVVRTIEKVGTAR